MKPGLFAPSVVKRSVDKLRKRKLTTVAVIARDSKTEAADIPYEKWREIQIRTIFWNTLYNKILISIIYYYCIITSSCTLSYYCEHEKNPLWLDHRRAVSNEILWNRPHGFFEPSKNRVWRRRVQTKLCVQHLYYHYCFARGTIIR